MPPERYILVWTFEEMKDLHNLEITTQIIQNRWYRLHGTGIQLLIDGVSTAYTWYQYCFYGSEAGYKRRHVTSKTRDQRAFAYVRVSMKQQWRI